MAKPYQLNVNPPEEILEEIDEIIEKYKDRHSVAKSRNAVVADVLVKFLPVWKQILEEQDQMLAQHAKRVLDASAHKVMGKR